jgi:hypothetical protein
VRWPFFPYPFGGGGTFCGTAGGSPSTGAKKFGAPAPLGLACGGDDLIGVAAGAMEDGATDAGACAGANVGMAVPPAGGALTRGAGALSTWAVAGAFRRGALGRSGEIGAGRQV